MSESYGGPTLAETIRQSGRLLPDEAARLIGELAEELAALHAEGRAHGDITPYNVRVRPDGRAVLAHHPDPNPDVAFVAPEVLDGGPPTPASDLWSLGATAYAAIEGRDPFLGLTDDDVSTNVRVGPIPTCLHGGSASWVVALLLNRQAAARLTAAEVVEAVAGMARPVTPVPAPGAFEPAPEPVPDLVPETPVARPTPARAPAARTVERATKPARPAAKPPAKPAARPLARPTAKPRPKHALEPSAAHPATVAVAVAEELVERTGPVEIPRQPAFGWLLLLAFSVAAIVALLLLGP